MKLIVGLGNPGVEYERTRHNAGFLVIDRLVRRHGAGAIPRGRFQSAVVEAPVRGERCVLMKPTTYMNRSGQAVGEAVRFYKLDPAADLLVIVDDVYLPAGTIRLRPAGGDGGHNGLADIQRALGTEMYPRLRIGVGEKPAHIDQSDYVLARFAPEEWALVEPALDKAADAAETFASEGLVAAMNKFNVKPRSSKDDAPGESPTES